jgi:hypothetical protein
MGKQKSKEEIHGLFILPFQVSHNLMKIMNQPIEKGDRLCIVFCIDAHIFPKIKTPQNRRQVKGSYF